MYTPLTIIHPPVRDGVLLVCLDEVRVRDVAKTFDIFSQ